MSGSDCDVHCNLIKFWTSAIHDAHTYIKLYFYSNFQYQCIFCTCLFYFISLVPKSQQFDSKHKKNTRHVFFTTKVTCRCTGDFFFFFLLSLHSGLMRKDLVTNCCPQSIEYYFEGQSFYLLCCSAVNVVVKTKSKQQYCTKL